MLICQNCQSTPASGLFEVTEKHFANFRTVRMLLCAKCGFTEMYSKRRIVDASTSKQELVYTVSYIHRVVCLATINRRGEAKLTPGGLKHYTLGVDDEHTSPFKLPPVTRAVTRLSGKVQVTSTNPRLYCLVCNKPREAIVARLPKRPTRAWCKTCFNEGELVEER